MIRSLDSRIESTPGVLGGKPRIAGRRIAVSMVAQWHLEEGQSVEHICGQYDLTPAEVYAALAYYFDHRGEIDRQSEEERDTMEKLKASPSLLRQRLKELDRLDDLKRLEERDAAD